MREMLGKSGGLRLCFSGFRRPPPPPPNKMQPALTAFKNFNSLFDPSAASDSDDTLLTTGDAPSSASTSQTLTLTSDDDEDEHEAPPPSADLLSTAIAARRLLPAAPGLSNSIFDSPAGEGGIGEGGGGVAVSTFSPDPYRDFRRSMEEMVAALGFADPRAHRSDLYELLLCYLALNRKHAHKYIVGAFADLLRSLADTAAPTGD